MSDNEQSQSEGSALRKQLEAALAEVKELKAYKKSNELRAAFSDFGLDPNTGPGKLAAQVYDGELSAEAARDWLTEQGFTMPDAQAQADAPADEPPPGMGQRIEQQERLAVVRDNATPAAAQRLSREEALALEKTDPQAVIQANAEGRIDWGPSAEAS